MCFVSHCLHFTRNLSLPLTFEIDIFLWLKSLHLLPPPFIAKCWCHAVTFHSRLKPHPPHSINPLRTVSVKTCLSLHTVASLHSPHLTQFRPAEANTSDHSLKTFSSFDCWSISLTITLNLFRKLTCFFSRFFLLYQSIKC